MAGEEDKGTPIQNQEWNEVVRDTVTRLTPPERGWILAFVLLFAVFQVSNYLQESERLERDETKDRALVDYFNALEQSRIVIEENRAQEIRRLQEIVKELTQTVARSSERTGRADAQKGLLERAAQQQDEMP